MIHGQICDANASASRNRNEQKKYGTGKKNCSLFLLCFILPRVAFVGADGREMYNREIMPRTCQMLLSLSLTIR